MIRKVLMALAVGAMVVASACGSPVEAACEKAVSCGKEKDLDQCVKRIHEQNKAYYESKVAECRAIGKAIDSGLSCTAGLSCDEIQEGQKHCSSARKELSDAIEAAFQAKVDCNE